MTATIQQNLTLSCVILTMGNRPAEVTRAVDSVLAQHGTQVDLVVVGNGADVTGLPAGVRAIRLPENVGVAAGRNAGVAACEGDVVLFLDDDVLAGPGLVSGHGRRHADSEPKLVLGYMPIELDGRRSAGDFATHIYARDYEGRCARYSEDPVSVLRELWGGNFSLPRSECQRVRFVNEAYTERYHPDRDFGIRCLEAGMTGEFDRGLFARHLHARSLEGFVRDARSQGAGRVLLHRLHPATLGPFDPGSFVEGLPRPVASLVAGSRRPRFHPLLAACLTALLQAWGRLRLWRAQDAAARLLRRIEQQRGALDMLHGRRAS